MKPLVEHSSCDRGRSNQGLQLISVHDTRTAGASSTSASPHERTRCSSCARRCCAMTGRHDRSRNSPRSTSTAAVTAADTPPWHAAGSTSPGCARWTWLLPAAYTPLRLARGMVADLRRPWEKTVPPQRLTPARVRRGFRNIRRHVTCPARAPKPSRPGPGRPSGLPNQRPATRHDVHIVTSTNTREPGNGKASESASPGPRRTGSNSS